MALLRALLERNTDEMAILETDLLRQLEEVVATTYPFVKSSQSTQLDTLINNALSLGQWELARIALRALFAQQPQEVLQKLRKLAFEGPPPGWYASAGLPTSYHLAWLAAGEYEDLSRQKASFPFSQCDSIYVEQFI